MKNQIKIVESKKILRCTQFECNNAQLVWMNKGEARQTHIGLLLAKIAAWYCPKCAGSYGGKQLDLFTEWWHNEGSGMPPLPGEDAETHVRRICEIAWSNGAYMARNGGEQ